MGGCTAVRLRRRRELDLFRVTAGQGVALLPVFCWKLVLRVGSSGEHVGAALAFEAVGIVGSDSAATTCKLGQFSGEQGRRSSLQERTFVCN